MIRRLSGKLASAAVSLFLASLAVFLLLDALPGDPATTALGFGASDATIRALRAELSLDSPWWIRYGEWVLGWVYGSGSISFTYGLSAGELIGPALLVTLPLAALAAAISTAVALPLGVLAAQRTRGVVSSAAQILVQAGLAIPNFWFGTLLVLVFSVSLGWTRAGGFPGWSHGFMPALGALILPALTLALPQAAILARVTRGALLDVTRVDFIRTARAKGCTPRQILWRHAFPNALIPVLTILGLQLSFLAAGAIIVETVFHLPGLGRMLFQSVGNRDLSVMKSLVMLFVTFVLVINLCVDAIITWFDPRLRVVPLRS